jgi:hypothetical protein
VISHCLKKVSSSPKSSSPEPVSNIQVKQNCKIEKQTASHHNMLTAGGEVKKQAPSKQAQQKPNSKAGQLVDYRAHSRTKGQHTNLNCHTSLREQLTKQLPLKDRRKKANITQPPGDNTTELWLKYQYQDCMLEE